MMTTFLKESLVPTLIILVAAAVVVLAGLPLAQTDWADGMRSNFGGQGTEQVVEAEDSRGGEDMGVFVYVAPLFKVTILMGIGGLLTASGLGIVKLVPRWIHSRPSSR